MRANRLSRMVGLVAVLTGFAGGLGAAGAAVAFGDLKSSAVVVDATQEKDLVFSTLDFVWS